MDHRVGKISALEPGGMMAVTAGDYDLVVFRHIDGTISVLADRCSHADVPLSTGTFEDGQIECSAHGAKFDAKTGRQLCMPAVAPVQLFSARVDGDDIVVSVPND